MLGSLYKVFHVVQRLVYSDQVMFHFQFQVYSLPLQQGFNLEWPNPAVSMITPSDAPPPACCNSWTDSPVYLLERIMRGLHGREGRSYHTTSTRFVETGTNS